MTLQEALTKVGFVSKKTRKMKPSKPMCIGHVTGLKDHHIFTHGMHTVCKHKGKFIGYMSKKDTRTPGISPL